MNNCVVTVCLNTYNHRKFITDALDSVLRQQTDFRFEVLVGDDFSTDGTREIVKEYSRRFPELVRILDRTHNLGPSRNGYELLNAATSPFIAYLEGDDFWVDPLKLQQQVNILLEHQHYGLVWTDIDIINDATGRRDEAVFQNGLLKAPSTLDDVLIEKPFFAPSTWVYRRSLRAVRKEYPNVDGSFPFMMEVMRESQIFFLSKVTTCYRQLQESASRSQSPLRRYEFLTGVYKIQRFYADELNADESVRAEIERRHAFAVMPYALALGEKTVFEWARNKTKLAPKKTLRDAMLNVAYRTPFGRLFVKLVFLNSRLKDSISRAYSNWLR